MNATARTIVDRFKMGDSMEEIACAFLTTHKVVEAILRRALREQDEKKWKA